MRLRFGAAGEGGIYREFGERFAALQNETDNGTIELRATAGSAANLRLLTGEYLQLAIAQADLAQGELTRYANDMQLYNAALSALGAACKNQNRPLPRGQFRL